MRADVRLSIRRRDCAIVTSRSSPSLKDGGFLRPENETVLGTREPTGLSPDSWVRSTAGGLAASSP